jgi:hypothetical protein
MTILMESELDDFWFVSLMPLDKVIVVVVSVTSGLAGFGISENENVELGRLPASELFALL